MLLVQDIHILFENILLTNTTYQLCLQINIYHIYHNIGPIFGILLGIRIWLLARYIFWYAYNNMCMHVYALNEFNIIWQWNYIWNISKFLPIGNFALPSPLTSTLSGDHLEIASLWMILISWRDNASYKYSVSYGFL